MEAAGKLIVWVLFALALGPFAAQAHPYHESFAELSWDAQHDKVRVALRAIPEDMEQALSQAEQRAIVLDDRLDTDKVLVKYFWQNFRIVDEAGNPLSLQWIGKEISAREAWFYFEFSVSAAKSLQLIDRVLVDWQPTQINRVLIFEPKKKKTVHVLRADSAPLLLEFGHAGPVVKE